MADLVPTTPPPSSATRLACLAAGPDAAHAKDAAVIQAALRAHAAYDRWKSVFWPAPASIEEETAREPLEAPLFEEFHRLLNELADMPATTLHGLVAKALIVHAADCTPDSPLIASILDDLVQIDSRG